MALWQISFFIIPKQELNTGTVLLKGEEGMFDDSVYWTEDYPKFFFDKVNDFLPQGKSWSENILMFGSESSNVFEVLIEDDKVVSLGFRIDFTANYEDVLRAMIEFCVINSLNILTTDLEILSLNFEFINSYIQQSPQVILFHNLLS